MARKLLVGAGPKEMLPHARERIVRYPVTMVAQREAHVGDAGVQLDLQLPCPGIAGTVFEEVVDQIRQCIRNQVRISHDPCVVLRMQVQSHRAVHKNRVIKIKNVTQHGVQVGAFKALTAQARFDFCQ